MNQPDFPQNPDELFDVVNEDGTPTGVVKRRADVHRDGDWHRAIHVWVYGVNAGGPFVLFNRRGLLKDTYPGRLDVTVGGHLGAGESAEQAFREIHEEIGIEPDRDRMQFLCTRKAYGEVERELQDVYLYRDDRALAEYQPNPAELEGLVSMPLDSAIAVFSGETAASEAIMLPSGAREVAHITVSTELLLPPQHWAHYLGIARAIRAELADDPR
jgi:isopentenyldiphosphate isomerase